MSKKKTYNKKKLYKWVSVILLILGFFGFNIPKPIIDYFENGPKEEAKQTQVNYDQTYAPVEQGQATFTQDEMTYDTKGWVEYHGLDKLGRPTGAEALLSKKMIGTGTKANKNIRPPGFITGSSPYGHSRGHLIANQFGGDGNEVKNLVTLYQTPVNSPYMTTYENKVREALAKGKYVRYRVTPLYDKEELMPVAIEIEAKSLDKVPTLNFKVIIPNHNGEAS